MSTDASKGLKRKIAGSQNSENDGVLSLKERKGEPPLESSNTLMVQKLSPEDWAATDIVAAEQGDEADPTVEEVSSQQSTTRGISWKGGEILSQSDGVSTEVSIMCKRYTSGPRSDCETQTYHFLPNVASIASESNAALDSSARQGKVMVDKAHEEGSFISCCVKGCGSKSCSVDASIVFYCLPASVSERMLWTEILNVDFDDVLENKVQVLCSKHFLTSQSSAGHKNVKAPKAKTRRKRTFDMLLAEEAGKVKQGIPTGRAKRTPKPNRNYDWAELMPLVRSEPDSFDDFEPPAPKGPVKPLSTARRGRKQSLDAKSESKEPNIPMEAFRTSHTETDDYGADISIPSVLRDRPPKPKGRPNKIRDMFSQTDRDLESFAKPRREVKVQCNLTAEPLVSCSSCSSIDWMRFESLLLDCITLVEGAVCNAVLTKCFKKILDDVTKPSYASNVLRILLGLERDLLETSKDIVLVSSQDDYEEVEIENVIHQEQAPVTGLKEIIPKAWQKAKVTKDVKYEDFVKEEEEEDSLGLVAATERDDDEYDPESYMKEEEEEREDVPNEVEDDDDDWDARKKGDAVPGVKKKKPGPKRKKAGTVNHDTSTTDSQMPSKCEGINEGSEQRSVDYSEGAQSSEIKKSLFACDECGKVFTKKQILKYHKVWRHNAERLGPCPYCKYKAPDATKLRVHIKRVHYGYKPYKCKYCSKDFKCHSNYKEHEAKHKANGKYECKYCSKKFAIMSTLERHERYHLDKRPYECNYCNKGFKTKPHLERHIKCIHLKEKNLQCEVCKKTHSNNWNLKMHMKTHDIAKDVIAKTCSICDSKFKNNAGLAAHMRKQHDVLSIHIDVANITSENQDKALEIHSKIVSSASAFSKKIAAASENKEQTFELLSTKNYSNREENEKGDSIPMISKHRTIIIQDGVLCNNDCDIKQMDNLSYSDFFEDSSLQTFELYTCNECSVVFQSKDEFLNHGHSPH